MPKAPRPFVAALAAIFAIALALANAAAVSAQAPNNPVGAWTLNWSFDNSAGMTPVGSQQICFLSNGTWYSPSFAGWHGLWFQKGNNAAGNGDHVSLNGNYAGNIGNDSFQLDFVTVNLMTGPWAEWRDNFVFVAWIRASLTRTGKCGPGPILAAKAAADAASTTGNPGGGPPHN
jgi:hypothetical protein